MPNADAAPRIDALESRFAYHERTVEELNEAVTRQWLEIESLKRQLARLEALLREYQAALPDPGTPEPPPPHY